MREGLSYIVRVFETADNGETIFRGTGIVVGDRQILTCKHVVCERDPYGEPTETLLREVVIASERGDISATATEITPHSRLDLALLRTQYDIASEPAVFLSGITRHHQCNLFSYPWQVSGYRGVDGGRRRRNHPNVVPFRPEYDSASESLTEVQLHGGLPAGFSGSPVLVQLDGQWLCLGIVVLGHEKAATSRMVASGPVVEFLWSQLVPGLGTTSAIVNASTTVLKLPENEPPTATAYAKVTDEQLSRWSRVGGLCFPAVKRVRLLTGISLGVLILSTCLLGRRAFKDAASPTSLTGSIPVGRAVLAPLFSDDFSTDLSQWNLYKGSTPNIEVAELNREGTQHCVLLDDLLNYGARALSKKTFRYVGIAIELSVQARHGHAGERYKGATNVLDQRYVGIAISPSNDRPLDQLAYVGWSGSSNPHNPGTAHCMLKYLEEDGTEKTEESGYVRLSDPDGWHIPKILVRSDGKVEFYIDDSLIYTSKHPMVPTYDGHAALSLGGRKSWYRNPVVRELR